MELRGGVAQRKVRLRRQDQHEQPSAQVQVAIDQPQPNPDRDQGDRQRRDQLEHQRGKERQPQRRECGLAVLARDLPDGLRLGLRPAEDL